MKHQEYIRIVPGADTAVLFIHGICGTPNHFTTQISMLDLVPENWSVYNVLLDGHGKGVRDFGKSSMKKWKSQVWGIFADLAQCHDQVVLVAHSMGTLFSIQLALENPKKVPFLFLIGVPLRPGLRLFGIVNTFRVALNLVREDKPFEKALRDDCGIDTSPWLWQYIGWIPRFLELFREIYRTEKVLKNLTVPCVAYQSKKDELVSNFTRGVLKRSGVVEIVDLKESTHCYYDPADAELLRKDFLLRCNTIKEKKA